MGNPVSTPLSLAIDGNEANVVQRVGSNVYAFELLCALEKITRPHPHINCTILLSTPPIKDWPETREGWKYQVIKPRPFWTQWALPIFLFLNSRKFDVFFTPGHYAPRLSSVPYVSSVMDVAYELFPEQFKKSDRIQLRKWTAYSVKHAEKVVVISQATKNDVIKQYKKSADDIVVAYPALTGNLRPLVPARAKSLLRKLHLKPPYVLYVGTLQPRKNIERLIEAFEHLVQIGWKRPRFNPDNLTLVLAGKQGWLAQPIVDRIAQSPLTNRIRVTGYIDELTKQALYENAEASVLVGLYEGFGIPPLESLRFGTVPVVSHSSSLPEVVGKAGILVDPKDPASITRGLQKAVSLTQRERTRYAALARQQLQKFSWTQSAWTVLDALQSVAAKHHHG